MTTMLEVMRGRQGIQEIPGKDHNPVIVGWAEAIGHAEVIDDETSWCSICMCSAALEADLPMPPHNIRMMARSWLTWGVAVEPGDIQPGDVAIWPRGTGWQGHVNIVAEVLASGKIKCIGGNQGGLAGGDAVTMTRAQDPGPALGFRRAVAPTVAALRAAGSTEIKRADQVQNVGTVAGGLSIGAAVVETLVGPIGQAPVHKDPAAALTFWQSLIKGIDSAWQLIVARPWLVFLVVGGLGAWWVGKKLKAARVAKHKEGVPLSTEVVEVNARGEVPA